MTRQDRETAAHEAENDALEWAVTTWQGLTVAGDADDLPVLCQGQADDMIAEDLDDGYRLWISRTGVADGEPYENTLTIETRDGNGRWSTLAHLDAADPTDRDRIILAEETNR